jgi:acyl-homoserine lactone synthase
VIEVITPGHHHLHAPLIEAMFRMRYRALIERCGWCVPGLAGARDRDAFDTGDTVYIVDRLPGTEDVVACARLNPTVKPHMLSELFARYCDLQGVPTGETIYEASRIAIDAGRFEKCERMEVLSRLESAATVYALRNGIELVTSFISEKVYLHNIQLWSTRPLGLPAYFEDDDRTYIPAISVMDEAALHRIEARRRMTCAGSYDATKADDVPSYARPASGRKPLSPAAILSLPAVPAARKPGPRRAALGGALFARRFDGGAAFLGAIIDGAKRNVASQCNRYGSQLRALRRGN